MKRLIFSLLMLMPWFCSAIEADEITNMVAKQVELDSAHFAKRMGWKDYRYTSTLRNTPSVANLSQCSVDLGVKASGSEIINNVRYRITCAQTKNNQKWSVNINTSVNYFMDVATLKKNVRKGHAIEEQDLVYMEQRVRKNDHFFLNNGDIIGEKTKRHLKIGRVLKKNDMQVDSLVLRNREVLIMIEHEHLNMTAEGIPLKSGELGDTIQVENKRSGNAVTAIIIGRDKVAVKVY